MTNSFNIGYNTDNMHISEAMITQDHVGKGFIHPIEDLEFKTPQFHEFMELVSKQFEFKEYDFSDSKKQVFKQYNSDHFIMFATGNSKETYCSIYSKTIDISQDIYNIYKKFYKADTVVKVYMTTYYDDNGRMNNSIKTLDSKDIESISDNYYPYINNDIMYKQFFALQENILLLTGKPGIGKSKLASSILKYAVGNPDIIPYDKMKENDTLDAQFINVAYIKNPKVLSDDGFWRELEVKEYDFVILDDLDYFLTTRDNEVTSTEEADKNKFLNQFLSFTDGIEKHKTKFIITTNQPFAGIDTALLRKGRLFDILELRDLSRAEGLVIWEENGLKEYDYLNVYGREDRILPADIGSEIAKRLIDSIDVALENYCFEDNISKVKQAQTIQIAGF